MPKADDESNLGIKIVNKISAKIEDKIKKVEKLRKENLKELMNKERNVIKNAELQTPGPGAYEIKYEYAEEKGPKVIQIDKLVFFGRKIRQTSYGTTEPI